MGGDDLRAGEQPDARRCREFAERLRAPRLPTRVEQRAATGFDITLDEHDAKPARCKTSCRREPCSAGTDDQHIGMIVQDLIACLGRRVGRNTKLTQTCSAPDRGLEQPLPRPSRAHEGLVVEAGGEQGREQTVDREQIEVERRPPVLAAHAHPRGDADGGGPPVGQRSGCTKDIDECAGLFRACRHDAAWSVVLETAPHQAHPVREQRRGDGIPGQGAQTTTVELELDSARRVGQQSGGDAPRCHGVAAPSGGVRTAATVPTAWISWVTVWRQTCRNWRQPAAWYHHS